MPDVHRHNDNGHILTLGAHPRPHYDAREEKYKLNRVIDISGIDLNQLYSLLYTDSNNNLWDPRPPIDDQDGRGACAAFAAVHCAEVCSWQSGNGQPIALNATELYWRDRQKEEGTNWQTDGGSTLADNLDFAISGLYAEKDVPENFSLSHDFSAEEAGKTTIKYVASHLPFYPGESSDPDYFVKAICAALKQGMPVDLGLNWYQPWFTPDANGVLPMSNLGSAVGGHSIMAWGYTPSFGGVVLCQNQWTASWNRQATNLGNHARPGDFAIPISFFRGNNKAYIEGRAVHWQAVQPQPNPGPQPGPGPSPSPSPTPQPEPAVLKNFLSWYVAENAAVTAWAPTKPKDAVAQLHVVKDVLTSYLPSLDQAVAITAPGFPHEGP